MLRERRIDRGDEEGMGPGQTGRDAVLKCGSASDL